jgi:hypothetical protein
MPTLLNACIANSRRCVQRAIGLRWWYWTYVLAQALVDTSWPETVHSRPCRWLGHHSHLLQRREVPQTQRCCQQVLRSPSLHPLSWYVTCVCTNGMKYVTHRRLNNLPRGPCQLTEAIIIVLAHELGPVVPVLVARACGHELVSVVARSVLIAPSTTVACTNTFWRRLCHRLVRCSRVSSNSLGPRGAGARAACAAARIRTARPRPAGTQAARTGATPVHVIPGEERREHGTQRWHRW